MDEVDDKKIVLFGRGRGTYSLPGNQRQKELIKQHIGLYKQATTKTGKTKVAISIISQLKSEGYRFVKKDPKTGELVEPLEPEIKKKVAHSLRDFINAADPKRVRRDIPGVTKESDDEDTKQPASAIPEAAAVAAASSSKSKAQQPEILTMPTTIAAASHAGTGSVLAAGQHPLSPTPINPADTMASSSLASVYSQFKRESLAGIQPAGASSTRRDILPTRPITMHPSQDPEDSNRPTGDERRLSSTMARDSASSKVAAASSVSQTHSDLDQAFRDVSSTTSTTSGNADIFSGTRTDCGTSDPEHHANASLFEGNLAHLSRPDTFDQPHPNQAFPRHPFVGAARSPLHQQNQVVTTSQFPSSWNHDQQELRINDPHQAAASLMLQHHGLRLAGQPIPLQPDGTTLIVNRAPDSDDLFHTEDHEPISIFRPEHPPPKG